MAAEPVDHLDKQSERLRQGTGPRAMVSVLFASMVAAATAGALIVAYFALSQ